MTTYEELNTYCEEAGIPEVYSCYLYDKKDTVTFEEFVQIRNEMLVDALGIDSIEFGSAISDFEYTVFEKLEPDAFNEYQSQFEKPVKERKYFLEYLTEQELTGPYPIKELDKIWHTSTEFYY